MIAFLSHFVDLSSANSLLSKVEALTEEFAQEYFKDRNAKNALIDDIITHLESLKDK